MTICLNDGMEQELYKKIRCKHLSWNQTTLFEIPFSQSLSRLSPKKLLGCPEFEPFAAKWECPSE